MIGMGSFYMTCGVTNTTIADYDTCYGFLLINKQKGNARGHNIYINDRYDLLPIAIKGTYADYGRIDIDESWVDYLDNALKWLTEVYDICNKDGDEVSSIEDREGRHDLNDILRASEREECYYLKKKKDIFRENNNVEMLLVSGRFINTLLKNYRDNPYLESPDKEISNEELDNVLHFDRDNRGLSYLINKDFETQRKIINFLERYLHHTNTPILPSNYGSQEVDLGGLKIMADFFKGELESKRQEFLEDTIENEEWNFESVLKRSFGGHVHTKDGWKDF